MGDIGRLRRRIVVRPLTEPVLAHGTSLTHRAAGDGRHPLVRSRLALMLAGVWAMRRLAPTTDPGPDQLG